MTNHQNTAPYPPRVRHQQRDTLRGLRRGVFLALCGASVALFFVIQYDGLGSLLDDRTFLSRARVSAPGSVSQVSTSVFSTGEGPATVICHEQVTFQPALNKPITFLSDGAEQSWIGPEERCNEEHDQVMVLYNPRHPSDARVAEVVHHDLVVKIVQGCYFGLFTLILLGSGLVEV